VLKDVSKCQSTVSMVLKVASIRYWSPSGKEPSAYFSLAISLALGLYLKLYRNMERQGSCTKGGSFCISLLLGM